MHVPPGPLNASDIEHFLQFGYVKVPDCFDTAPGSLAHQWVQHHWERAGYDPNDPATWIKDKIHFPSSSRAPISTVSPKAYAAIGQLLGGHDRIHPSTLEWCDAFIANYHLGSDKPWVSAKEQTSGWHKDGDFFVHFLDSPEQALLTIILWTDVHHQGGPTYLAADSVAQVARFLANHPEGAWPATNSIEAQQELAAGRSLSLPPINEMIQQCSDFREATGKAGDVYLLHPFVLHASSQNVIRHARLITNPPVALSEPMRFNRADKAYSVVEQGILNALNVDQLDFQPLSPRRRITPARHTRQALLKAQIDQRLGKTPLKCAKT